MEFVYVLSTGSSTVTATGRNAGEEAHDATNRHEVRDLPPGVRCLLAHTFLAYFVGIDALREVG